MFRFAGVYVLRQKQKVNFMPSKKTREELLNELQKLEKELERLNDAVSGYEVKCTSATRAKKQRGLFLEKFSGIVYGGRTGSLPEFYQGSVESITGYTAKELLAGTPLWRDIVYHEDVSSYDDELERRASIVHHSSQGEYRITHKNGEIRWVQEHVSNFIDDSGKPSYYRGTIYDITEYGHAETERVATINAGSPDAFVAGIARDFNNLLLAIADNVSLAKTQLNPEDKIYALLSEAERISFMGKDLTQQLITFSRSGKQTGKIMDLRQLVRNTAEKSALWFDVRCKYLLSEDLFYVEGDES
jgi:PAS domain S-box-containing protein